MAEYEIRKITSDDDPRRCTQQSAVIGQCRNVAVEGTHKCACHGGTSIAKAQANRSLRNYRLDKFRASVEHHSSSQYVKSLRDEIGILRVMLEERWNACNSNIDLMLHSGAISDLVGKIEKLVTSCSKLELQMKETLDRSELITFTQQILAILTTRIDDPELLDSIGQDIEQLFSSTDD